MNYPQRDLFLLAIFVLTTRTLMRPTSQKLHKRELTFVLRWRKVSALITARRTFWNLSRLVKTLMYLIPHPHYLAGTWRIPPTTVRDYRERLTRRNSTYGRARYVHAQPWSIHHSLSLKYSAGVRPYQQISFIHPRDFPFHRFLQILRHHSSLTHLHCLISPAPLLRL